MEVQPKLYLTQNEDGNLTLDEKLEEIIYGEPKANWRLLRESDGLIKQSTDIKWLEFDKDGTFKTSHPLPAIGVSLIMSPFNHFFTWQTTEITELIISEDAYIKFKTKNSNYELFKIGNE